MNRERNEELVAARKRAGKTQRQVAADIGNTESAYQRYEQGLRMPGVVIAIRIADALGVQDLRELWGDSSSTPGDRRLVGTT